MTFLECPSKLTCFFHEYTTVFKAKKKLIHTTNTSSSEILIQDTKFMMTQRCNKTTKVFSNLRFETYSNTLVHTF